MNDLVVNGWRIYLHPLFLEQFEDLIRQTEAARAKDPEGYQSKQCSKILAAVRKVGFELIPSDPADPAFRQGKTLGDDHKDWFRAKFLQQFRLFFRYDARSRVIVLVWVNDEDTRRAYGSKTDAYLIFRKMLKAGNPPSDWETLVAEAMRQKRGRSRVK